MSQSSSMTSNLVQWSLLVLAIAAASPMHLAQQSEPKLESLLEGKQAIVLSRLSQAQKLIEQVDQCPSDKQEICMKYKDSLQELSPLLTVMRSGNICNLNFVQQIRHYHESYIAKDASKPIPDGLRQFFISLCFQVSAECKMALINNLEYDTKDKITANDYHQIQFLERYGATLLDNEEKLEDFDDIILIGDHIDTLSPSEQKSNQIIVKTKTNSMMRGLVRNCELKFKPFYEKLILPLIQLSNMGYNYKGELIERELEELNHNNLVRRWYNILQTCEAFRAIEIYEDNSESSSGIGDKQMLTFIGPEEAELLRLKKVKSMEEQVEQELEQEKEKPIEYEPLASHNHDELWIRGQGELEKLVDKYKNSATEASRIKAKLMKKLFTRVKSIIMSGKLSLVASELMGSCSARTGTCGTAEVDIKQDLIMMVDDAVRMNENNEMIAKGQAPLEQAVAGSKRLPSFGQMGVPAKQRYVPGVKDETKTSTKFFKGFLARFLPSKWDVFFSYIGLLGFMFIALGLILAMAG